MIERIKNLLGKVRLPLVREATPAEDCCETCRVTSCTHAQADSCEQLRNAAGPGGGLRVGRRCEEMRRKDGRRC
jgi:hypothetical protein